MSGRISIRMLSFRYFLKKKIFKKSMKGLPWDSNLEEQLCQPHAFTAIATEAETIVQDFLGIIYLLKVKVASIWRFLPWLWAEWNVYTDYQQRLFGQQPRYGKKPKLSIAMYVLNGQFYEYYIIIVIMEVIVYNSSPKCLYCVKMNVIRVVILKNKAF